MRHFGKALTVAALAALAAPAIAQQPGATGMPGPSLGTPVPAPGAAQAPKPAMGVASETMTPLKPSLSRRSVVVSVWLTVAGRKASIPAWGSMERTKAGKAICADMTDFTPAAMAAR